MVLASVSEQPPLTPRGPSLTSTSMSSPRQSPTSAAKVTTGTGYGYLLRGSSGDVVSSSAARAALLETLEGYLLKRGSHLSSYVRWNDRYFVLRPRDGTLSYYLSRGDVRPKGVIALSRECTVSDVYMGERREKKSSA